MPDSHSPLWQIAFRPFFLGASIFITVALILWALVLSNALPTIIGHYQPYSGWFNWHSHEMIFGFVQAIAIGFLLTASRNWAGQSGVSSNFIKILIASWLMTRIAWFMPTVPVVLIALLDGLTPLLAALGLAQTLRGGERDNGKGSQRHNWPFVGLMIVFALMQFFFHALLVLAPQYITLLMQASVLAMAAMTLWVSGRVLPFFTRARLQTPPPIIPSTLLKTSMLASWLLIPSFLTTTLLGQHFWLHVITAFIALIAAGTQSYRLYLFYRRGVSTEPMLWSLYCAFAWIIIGYVLLSLSFIIEQPLPWLHAITLGGLLTMIVSMMARVGLGHTGRPILALKGIALAFIALQIATLIRIIQPSIIGYLATLILVILAMTVFLFHYFPILIKPRPDGRPG
tara:strand:- start:7882 stop:9078 length:1197 start_codon:yes stop_codon:yes gene_type:complete